MTGLLVALLLHLAHVAAGMVADAACAAWQVVDLVAEETPPPRPNHLPQPQDVPLPPGLNQKAGELMGLAKNLLYVAGVLSFFYAGYKIMSAYRAGEQSEFGPAFKVAIGLIVGSSATGLADWLMF